MSMMSLPSDELLHTAIAAARAGGRHALNNRARRSEVLSTADNDVKLRLDVESQEVATRVILTAHPGHVILGEESTGPVEPVAPGQYEWIIDPIDGTVNFTHGFPAWCTSVAVRSAGTVVAGAIYAPVTDELYTATVDGPALMNNEPLRVSTVATLRTSLVLTGIEKATADRQPTLAYFQAILSSVQRPRIVGSAALDLCHVARGRADAYFESSIYLWDIAAAGLILERAGGKTEKLADYGGNRMRYIGTNGLIHEAFKTLLLGADKISR